MDPAAFNAVQPVLDKFNDLVGKHLANAELQQLLSELGRTLGPGKIVSVDFTVDVFDEERQRDLPLLTTGLSAVFGKEPFRTWGDSTPQRYVVAEGIQVVPHDRCPSCWNVWDFKLQNPSCRHCGLTLGDQCKMLLDTDVCPEHNGDRLMMRLLCDLAIPPVLVVPTRDVTLDEGAG